MAVIAVVISAVGLYFAARAARASRETVQLTKELRWEADVRRVVQALVAVDQAAVDLVRLNPNLDEWTRHQRLRDAQQELERALAFPWFLHPNPKALELLEELRADDLAADPVHTQAVAHEAATLVTIWGPPPRMPAWWVRFNVFVVTHQPKLRSRDGAK